MKNPYEDPEYLEYLLDKAGEVNDIYKRCRTFETGKYSRRILRIFHKGKTIEFDVYNTLDIFFSHKAQVNIIENDEKILTVDIPWYKRKSFYNKIYNYDYTNWKLIEDGEL